MAVPTPAKPMKIGMYSMVPCSVQSVLPGASGFTIAGGNQETWVFPANVAIDLKNIVHTFTYTAVANTVTSAHHNYLFIFLNMLPWRQVIFTCEGKQLLNLTDAMMYMNMTTNAFTTMDEFLQNDIGSGPAATANGFIEFSRRNNTTVTPVSATATTTDLPQRPGYTTANIAYTEQMYLENGSRNAARPVLNYRYRLSRVLFGTIFSSIAQDFMLGNQTTLTFVYEAMTRWAFTSSRSCPSSASTRVPNVASTIGSQSLWVPVQQDPSINEQLLTQYRSGGLTYLYDDLLTQNFTLTGTSQSWAWTIAQGAAKTVKMLGFALWHNTQSSTTALDHDVSVTNGKLTSFYTQINGQRVEQPTVTIANGDDWVIMKQRIPQSPIMQTSNIFHYNWVWIQPLGIENCRESLDKSVLQGWDLSSPLTYGLQATTITGTWQHRLFAVVQRGLTLTQATVTIT